MFDDINVDLNDSSVVFKEATPSEQLATSFQLWLQVPWRKIHGSVVLEVTISGSLPIEPDPMPWFDLGPHEVRSLPDLMRLFIFAAHDPRVAAIHINMGQLTCGYSKLQEIRRCVAYFRQSGKKVVGWAEEVREKELLLASELDAFYLAPEGVVDLRGMSFTHYSLKGLLDKLGILPLVQRLGAYKTGEGLASCALSAQGREGMSSLLVETAKFWCKSMSRASGLSAEEVLRVCWGAVPDPVTALRAAGLLHGLAYKDEVMHLMQQQRDDGDQSLGDFDLFAHYLALPRRTLKGVAPITPPPCNPSKDMLRTDLRCPAPAAAAVPCYYSAHNYLRKMRHGSHLLSGLPVAETSRGPRIAVVNIAGSISSSTVSGVRSLLRDAAQDDDIIAVVLRIDSPGGSASASAALWREVCRLVSVKPVIASLSDVAASGAYYIAAAADAIVADELGLTGSIGVLSLGLDVRGMCEKVGVAVDTLALGPAHAVAEARTAEHAQAQHVYGSFLDKVRAGRGMSAQAVHEAAQGRVWTGGQALRLGLVDHAGGLWKALNIASALAGTRTGAGPMMMQMMSPAGG